MSASLAKALLVLVPAGILFSGSLVLFAKGRTVPEFLELFGAGCLMLVVLTHIAEGLGSR